MQFLVDYQQHKYTDQSDNPPLRTWQIFADTPEEAFDKAQRKAFAERAKGRKIGNVRRTMRTGTGDIVTADGDYLQCTCTTTWHEPNCTPRS